MDRKDVLLVVLGYPSGKMREKVHFECIESLKDLNLDSMLISKCPASTELQKKFNYFIYSQCTDELNRDLSPNHYLITQNFKLYVANQKHTASILDSIKTSISFSKKAGYKFIIFLNYDHLFHSEDLIKIGDLVDKTIENKKEGFFFKFGADVYFSKKNFAEESHTTFLNWYETVIFGMSTDFFEINFNLPTSVKEIVEIYDRGEFTPQIYFMAETIFYHYLKKHEENFEIINQSTIDYFSKSKIDRIRTGYPIMEIVKNSNNPDNPIAFFFCDLREDTDGLYLPKFGPKTFIVRKNGEIFTENRLDPGCWCYTILNKKDVNVSIECYSDDGDLELFKNYESLEREDSFYSEGDITFNY